MSKENKIKLSLFEPDIEFSESDIKKHGSEISVGKYQKLDVERDRLIFSDYHHSWGMYLKVHETDTEKIYYMLYWTRNKRERQYGLKVVRTEYKGAE